MNRLQARWLFSKGKCYQRKNKIPHDPVTSPSLIMAEIRTLIVDDEPEARSGLRSLLEQDTQIKLIGECSNGTDAVDAIRMELPDLVLLDVQMPGLNGFDVLQEIKSEHMPLVIFVTAYDQYSLKAFEVHAVDYLLKPFTNGRFREAIDQAKQQIRSQKDLSHIAQRMNLLLSKFESNPPRVPVLDVDYLHRIAVKEGEKITFLDVDSIDWIEAADNYICLHVGRRTYLLRSKLSDIEKQLNPKQFLRVHRSRIVNIEQIQEMQPQGSGDCILILKDGTEVTSSRTYREQRRRLLNPL